METGGNITGGRVEAKLRQMFFPDLLENFEPVSSPCSNLFDLEFAPGDGLTKVKLGERRLQLGKRGLYIGEA